MAANPYSGLKTAKTSGSGNYLDPGGGEYVLRITGIQHKDDLQDGGQATIVDFEVVESTNPKDPKGATRNWFQKKNQSFDGAILEFLFAVLKIDPNASPELVEKVQAQSPDLMWAGLQGKFNGQLVRCTTKHKLTKVNKKDFTRHCWSPYNETKAA